MAFLSYLQIYASYFCGILLYFLPGVISYKQFALIMAFFSAYFLLRYIVENNFKVTRQFFETAVIYLFILFGYKLVTPALHGDSMPTALCNSYFLALVGQIFPAVLTSSIVANDVSTQKVMKNLVPYVAVIFTVVSMVCTLNPSGATSIGLIDNENGFNYQTASYVAAFSSGLIEYYLICRDINDQLWVFRARIGVPLSYLILLLDLIVVLLSGGRGGFVTYIFFLLFTVFLLIKKGKVTERQLLKGIGAIIVVLIVGYFAIKYVAGSSISTSGFLRIVNFLNDSSDNARAMHRAQAFNMFNASPVLGNGFGSIFYDVGVYSHNFFTDALAETGLAGTAIILAVLIYGGICFIRLICLDFTDSFWGYVFFCGFVLAMFSGYYLTNLPLWWALLFLISKGRFLPQREIKV